VPRHDDPTDTWDAPPSRPPVWDPSRYGYGPLRSAEPEPALAPVVVAAPSRRWLPMVLAGVIGAALAASAVVAALLLLGDDTQRVESVFRLPEPGTNANLGGEVLDIQGVLAAVQPSVVTLDVGVSIGPGVFEGAGTGLVIEADGLILTNAHVIEQAEEITVTFFDGTSTTAEVVGSFPDDDIAIIRAADVSGLVPATLGSSEDLRVGDDVVAIGNALGLGGVPSVTSGIVSAKERSIDAENISLENLLQTDAAINPGNSGGPLVNAFGQVVGINTAIIDDAQNVGFAIAIDVVKPLIERAQDGDADLRPDTAFLGVTTISVPSLDGAVLEEFGVASAAGAFVQDVVDASPAADAGIVRGDVIVGLDDDTVDSATDVARGVRERNPGDIVRVQIERAGEPLTIEIELTVR
jgi:serine protease Do